MALVFDHLCAWFAPILSFTTEEAWSLRPAPIGKGVESVHLLTFPTSAQAWGNSDLAAKWQIIRDVRRVVTGALEPKRTDKTIGSSLEAAPIVYLLSGDVIAAVEGVDLAEVCITSGITVISNGDFPADAFRLPDFSAAAVVFAKADGQKCARCWKILPTVGTDAEYPDLSPRDADAVRYFVARAQAAA